LFGDPTLTDLESQVDGANPNLATALAAFQRARAFVAEADSGAYPTLSVGGQITTNRQSNRRPLRGNNQPNQYLANTIDAQAHYEVDLWDRVANIIKASRQAAQASAADLESVRLSLHAELADDYVELRGLDAQIGVLRNAVHAYGRAREVTQSRFDGKISPGMDVSRAEAQLNQAQASLTEVESRRALVEHAIAVLVGKLPAELSIPAASWVIEIPTVSAGLPSRLLERRPDVASAAAFYPTLSLDILYGLQDTGFNLFSLPNDLWAVGPGLALPLFEGGLRHAQEAAAIGAYQEAAGQYRATVLTAFQEVEDALSQIRLLATEAAQEDAAVAAAKQTVRMTTSLYQDGATNFLEVVVAQTAELQAEQDAVDLRTRRAQSAISLIRALGGGWTRDDLPAGKSLGQIASSD
jgi:NodT family efflux transporter outer membrane factor (OMF) lipoprotein